METFSGSPLHFGYAGDQSEAYASDTVKIHAVIKGFGRFCQHHASVSKLTMAGLLVEVDWRENL
jgi:hypothetical protein